MCVCVGGGGGGGVKVYILLKLFSIPTEKLIFGECCCQDNKNIWHQR